MDQLIDGGIKKKSKSWEWEWSKSDEGRNKYNQKKKICWKKDDEINKLKRR